jgi:hypothetical protein
MDECVVREPSPIPNARRLAELNLPWAQVRPAPRNRRPSQNTPDARKACFGTLADRFGIPWMFNGAAQS